MSSNFGRKQINRRGAKKEGGVGVCLKPQNRTKNNRKPQNRNKFRSKLKTASKIRKDVLTAEVFEAHIFGRETGKTLNRIAK